MTGTQFVPMGHSISVHMCLCRCVRPTSVRACVISAHIILGGNMGSLC